MKNNSIIESKENAKVKLIASLKLKKNREKHKLILIEGLRSVQQLIDNDIEIKLLAFSDYEYEKNKEYVKIFENFSEVSCLIKSAVFNQIADTSNTQGILALVNTPEYNIKDITGSEKSRILLFDRIQDPGNAGTLIRTADAAGFDAILYTKGTVDLFSSKVNRSAMGSNLYTPVAEVDLEQLTVLKQSGFSIYATSLDNYSLVYDEVEYNDKVVIILGNEANGVSKELLDLADEKIYIPIYGKAESLNVAVAGAILMYETLKVK